ncbi:MAG: cytochrome b N-terminal domain-containing protein [Armatimonadetes bacterium]|nr:cytochrome b N-terminal domain-containing protein [Armatimonadota bacterium]
MYNRAVNRGWKIWSWVDNAFNKIYPQDYNPMYYLGGVSNLFFWFVIGTGIVLFLYYKPSLEEAYGSVDYLTQQVPYGQAVRGLHRYGADAMLIFVVLHWLRVWWTDRYRKFRSLAWISGVVLLVLTLLMGVSGYLLVWDERSLLLIRMTQWMVGGEQTWLGRLLVGGDRITDYTLTRFLFFHLGVPFLMLLFLWMHYIRINRPVVYPPALLTLQLFGIVFVACYLFPTVSMPRANLERLPEGMLVDWFFQWGYAGAWWLQQNGLGSVAYPFVALGLIAVSGLFFALPYLTQGSYLNVVKVIPEKCTGCEYCAIDCHANAIRMIPTPANIKSKGGKKVIAEILPTRCAECGICVGACPFGAIELPMYPEEAVLTRIRAITTGARQTVAVGNDRAVPS